MKGHEELLERMRSANPVPHPDQTEPDELQRVFSLITERRTAMTASPKVRPDRRHLGLDPPPGSRRKRAAAFAGAAIALIAAVGITALVLVNDGPPRSPAATTVSVPSVTAPPPTAPQIVVPPAPAPSASTTPPATAPATTDVVPTTVPTAEARIPALGEGWDLVVSDLPDDPRFLDPGSIYPTQVGYYVFFNDPEQPAWALVDPGVDPATVVDVNVPPGDGRFIDGGPGIVAWTNVGPESRTESQLWVSSDGRAFERVAEDLLAGCAGVASCQGTRIISAATSPDGTIVALAYDPLAVGDDGECCDLNPVSLVSHDGYNWTRTPIDLTTVLPAEWHGAADIENPMVHVAGRWLTYGTQYFNDCMCTRTALFATSDGVAWNRLDSGGLSSNFHLARLAANADGVVALTWDGDLNLTVFWSRDGTSWTRSELPGDPSAMDGFAVGAYDDGYVVATGPAGADGPPRLDTIFYSPDGTSWTSMPLLLDQPTAWNEITGDGRSLVAIGIAGFNERGIWHWVAPEAQ